MILCDHVVQFPVARAAGRAARSGAAVDLARRLRHAPRVQNARSNVGEARPGSTLHDLFTARARTLPESEALRFVQHLAPEAGGNTSRGERVVRVTFRELAERGAAIARGLAALDASGALPPSARVAILCEPRLEWVLADVACVLAGLVSVPLHANIEPDTLRRVLTKSDSQVVIAENPWQARKLLDVVARLPTSPRLVLIDEVMTLASGATMSLSELGWSGPAPTTLAEVERRGALLPDAPRELHDEDGCWTICYTQGTEGQAKGVMWTHRNVASLTASLAGALPAPDKSDKGEDVQLLGVPLAQALGRVALWTGLVGPGRGERGGNAPLVTALPRSEVTLFDDARLLRPNLMIAVPSIYERARADVLRGLRASGPLMGLVSRWSQAPARPPAEATLIDRARDGIAVRFVRPALARCFGPRCRAFISGGAPLGEDVQAFYARHGIALREAYGLVETAAITHVDNAEVPQAGSVGLPLPGVEQRLGADGELLLRGPQVSPGYWRDPQETAKVFDPDGWFATGDLARIDPDGRVFVTGRKREIIVLSNGRTLAPRPIETCLREEALVAQAFVHGERRDFATALIALDPDELARFAKDEGLGGMDFAALSRHPAVHARLSKHVAVVNQRLPPHAQLRKHAVLAEALSAESGTLTPSNTLRRAAIAERYRTLLDSFYAEPF